MKWSAIYSWRLSKRAASVIQTGPFGLQLTPVDYVSEGIPVIMPKDIVDGSFA